MNTNAIIKGPFFCQKFISLFFRVEVNKQLLFVLAFLFLGVSYSIAQVDTPCEGAHRWVDGAAWNLDGTVDDNVAQNVLPKGIVKCGSSAETQPSVGPFNNSIYNSASFDIDLSGDTCIDPSTGLTVTPLNPTDNEPIIWFNFDVRPQAGSFQIQINDNSGDTIAWALYLSNTHEAGTHLALNGQQLSGDCGDLVKVACGVESSNTWNTIPINGADFLEATNFYLAVWDQDADGDVEINNFKARFGCGDASFLTCSLTTSAPEEVCNNDGTYTVNIPIEGINGEFVGYDANANNVNGLSNTVCLTNPGTTNVTSGTISLTYNQGVDYSIEIFETNNSSPPTPVIPSASCDHPDPFPGDPNNGNADSCISSVNGTAPVCCVPEALCVDLDDVEIESCSAIIPSEYDAGNAEAEIADVFSGVVTCGAVQMTHSDSAISGDVCSGGATITRTYTLTDDGEIVIECTRDFVFNAPDLVVSCPSELDVSLPACSTEQEIADAYAIWSSGFSVSGGCNTSSNIGDLPTLPLFACGEGVDLSFTLSATDDCDSSGCSGSFIVAPAEDLVLSAAPLDVTTDACEDPQVKFNQWISDLQSMTASGGCNAAVEYDKVLGDLSVTDYCTLTEQVIEVMIRATDDCGETSWVSSTFTVPAYSNDLAIDGTCPGDPSLTGCATSNEIDVAWDAWISGLNAISASGGCNAYLEYSTPIDDLVKPNVCSDQEQIVSILINAKDDCGETNTIECTFTIGAYIDTIEVTACPDDPNLDGCSSQAEIDAAWNSWIADVQAMTASGSCGPITPDVNPSISSLVKPTACVLSIQQVSVNVSASDLCGQNGGNTCTFTVQAYSNDLSLSAAPSDVTTDACEDPQLKFLDWISGLYAMNASGGCNAYVDYSVDLDDLSVSGYCNTTEEVITVYIKAVDDCTETATVSSTFTVPAYSNDLAINCPQPIVLNSSLTEQQIVDAYNSWVAGFTFSGGCTAFDNINEIPSLPNYDCGTEVDISFDYLVIDDCNPSGITCSSSFYVPGVTPLSVNCPTDASLPECSTEADILAAYNAWKNGFSVNNGDNPTSNIGDIPSLPDFACGEAVNLSFTLNANDACTSNATCSSTFSVAAADDLMISDVQDLVVNACDFENQAALDAAFASWLSGFGYTGGCDVQDSGLDGLSAPDLCAEGDGDGDSPQTFDASVFGLGDIAFSAYNSETAANLPVGVAEDSFTIVLLRSVASGVEIGFTENGWLPAGGFRSGESSFVLQFTSDYPAGTQIILSRVPFEARDQHNNIAGTVTGSGLSLATGGDQIFAYDPANIPTSVNETGFVAAIHMNGAWQVPADGDSSSKSIKPSVFTDGVNSISIAPEIDNARYTLANCNSHSDFNDLRTRLNTAANWETNDLTGYVQNPPLCDFTENDDNGGNTIDVAVTYTATGACDSEEDMATFTLITAPELSVTCPDSVSLDASYTEQQIQDAYDAWVAGFVVEGGCNTSTNIGEIPLLPDFVCGTAINLSFTLMASDNCNVDALECNSTFEVEGAVGLTVSCPADVNLPSCSTEQEIADAYAIWSAGFTVNNGTNPTSNIASLPALPSFVCGDGVNLSFELTASDICVPNGVSCESSFNVGASTPLTVECPDDVNLPSCSTAQEIQDAYDLWVAGFAANDGCNASSNIGDIPSLPDFACGEAVNLSFTLNASDSCVDNVNCTSTFNVGAAQELELLGSCPGGNDLDGCSTANEIGIAFSNWVTGLYNNFSASGGCDASVEYSVEPSTLQMPTQCENQDQVLSVLVYANDACGIPTQPIECTFIVRAFDSSLVLTEVEDVSYPSCNFESQDDLNEFFNNGFLQEFNHSGGCDPQVVFPGGSAPDLCSGGTVELTYTVNDLCEIQSETATFTIVPSPELEVTCPQPVALGSSLTEQQIQDAYDSWLTSFNYSGGCDVTTNIGSIPPLPEYNCGSGVDINFNYIATDRCHPNGISCTSTFTVEGVTPLSVSCPEPVVLDACATEGEIVSAYNAWYSGFVVNNGDNPISNIDDIPLLPDFDCGEAINLSFTLIASDACTDNASCSSTFIVKEAQDLVVECREDRHTIMPSCSTEEEIINQYNIWITGFNVYGGCNTISNLDQIPSLPDFVCGEGINLQFILTAEDDCTEGSCSGSFIVESAEDLTVSCPAPVNLNSPITDQEIENAYNIWVSEFVVAYGCYTTSNIADIPQLPEYVCGEDISLEFELIAFDDCNPNGISCVSQFTVQATEPVYAGEDGELTVCIDDANSYSLNDYITNEDLGGSWMNPDGIPHDGVFDTANDEAGVYTYTVTGTSPCPDDSATVLVVIKDLPEIIISPVDPLCIDEDAVQIFATPEGGSFSGNGVDENGLFDPAIAGAGNHIITYSYTESSEDDLVISGVYDGPLTGGKPKGVELFVLNDIADMSVYGFGSANNAGGSDGEEFTFPAVAASAGDYIYLASDTDEFTNFFGFAPDYTDGAANINGDDSLELFKNGVVVDVFGVVGVDGTGHPWEYLDGWAYRKNNTGADGSTFVLSNWVFSGKNVFDGESSNNTANTPIPIGSYFVANCSNSEDITVTVNPLPEIVVVGEPECTNYAQTYSVQIQISGGLVVSSAGNVVDNGNNMYSIIDIPKNTDIVVDVTSDEGCKDSISIEAPDCICIELDYDYTNVTCYGLEDATITVNYVTEGAMVTVNGEPYNPNALYTPGNYTIMAYFEGVDIDECIITENFEITQPDAVTVSATSTDVTCYGGNDGTITVSGLSEGATYVIQQNGVGPDLSGQTNFEAGIYIVKATLIDEGSRIVNTCEKTVLIIIDEPDEIRYYIKKAFKEVDCFDFGSHFVGVSTKGGTGELSFSWSLDNNALNNGWNIISDPSSEAVNFAPGYGPAIFTVTITDENGCQETTSVELLAYCDKKYKADTRKTNLDANLYPNPVRSKLNIEFNQEIESNVHIEVYNLVGTTMMSKRFNSIKNTNVTLDFAGLPSQVYYVKIITDKGTLIKKVILDK